MAMQLSHNIKQYMHIANRHMHLPLTRIYTSIEEADCFVFGTCLRVNELAIEDAGTPRDDGVTLPKPAIVDFTIVVHMWSHESRYCGTPRIH